MTLADAQAIAHLTGRKPATIRSWAHRGKLKRQGTNGAGRALYDIDEVAALLTVLLDDRPRRGLLDLEVEHVQHSDRSRTTAPRRR